MIVILDLGDDINNVLPIVVGALMAAIAIVLAGLSGLLVTVGFGGFFSLFNPQVRGGYGASDYSKVVIVFVGALLSLTFWIGLYAYLFFSLSGSDFLWSLLVLVIPILGAFGVLVLPGSDD